MSFTRRLRAVLLCAVLEVGTLAGVPMRPEQIVELMQSFNKPKLAHVIPSERGSGDGDDPGSSLDDAN